MKSLNTFLIITLVAIGVIIYIQNDSNDELSNEKCCLTCTKKGEAKYYSIDTKYDRCGECCFNKKLYWIYKIFEKGLTLADGKTCESLGYTVYENSESHGVFPLKITIDKYKKN